MRWNEFISGYLTFSKKDLLAIAFVVLAVLLLYFAPHFFTKPMPGLQPADAALQRVVDSATTTTATSGNVNRTTYTNAAAENFSDASTPAALFYFDPNTLDKEGWQRLGLRAKTAQTIENYRNKGGHFYKTDDIKKIWGLPNGFYERVKDYIQIADAKKEYVAAPAYLKPVPEKSNRKTAVLDVNTADTTALIALPGIGSKLAQRIVNFRDRLGGFATTDQIGETYGLPGSTFQLLKPYLQVHGVLKKFALNTATKDELKMHPYIKWTLANAIVEYRNQHGLFKKLDDLKNIMLIDETTYNKIAPYFSL